MKYKIETEYMADVELIVEVPEGEDPRNPNNWEKILYEAETDYQLHDVIHVEEYSDEESP